MQPKRWWMLTNETEVANAITGLVETLKGNQDARLRQYVIAARLYGNNTLYNMGSASTRSTPLPAAKERMSDPVIQSVVDTATARIGQNKPRPYFLTSGGSYKLQRKAKRLNKFCEGIFYEGKAYRIGAEAQRDGEVFGDGIIHVHNRHKRVGLERVLAGELWVDEVEAVYGKPRQMHWERAVDRELLVGVFPEKADIIRAAPRAELRDVGPDRGSSDMVLVRESWHLRSGPDAKDGKHCISIQGHLLDPLTKWEHDFFPFARFRWSPRPMGYWSQGLCEQLQPKQIELNKLLYLIQRSFHMAGSFKIFLEQGSKIVKEHINNDIATILTYTGKPPTWFVPQVIPPEYYQHVLWIVQSMYERAGFPQMVATGQKPAGLNSGQAIRDYKDTSTERQKTAEELNQDAYMDLAAMAIALAREIAQEEGFYEVKTPSGRALDTIRMKASDLDPSDWDLQCFPTSSLPKDPAGRLATIQEYIQAGFMTPRQGRRALDFPDLEAVESLANAAEDLLTKVLDAICDDGDFEPPEPTDDIGLAKELVVEYINRGRMQGLDEERLDLLRTYSAQVDALMAAAAPPPPAPGAMPPGAADPMAMGPGMGPPPAPPMPMEASPLVPQMPMAA